MCVWQLLRQLSAECHSRHHPHTIVEPQTVDDHYVTVNDPTTVHNLLAGRKVNQQPPWSPGAQPHSMAGSHGGGGGGVVLRLRRRPDSSMLVTSPPADNRHQSVILYDKQQMNRRAKHASHRPSYRRLKSTPSDRVYHRSPPSVPFLLLYEQKITAFTALTLSVACHWTPHIRLTASHLPRASCISSLTAQN